MSAHSKGTPFGTWHSPISAELFSAKRITIDEPVSSNLGKIYHTERRPSEKGRCCIVEYTNGSCRDVLPYQFSARTAVHEYGGSAITCGYDGNLIFSDYVTMGVFSLDPALGKVKILIQTNNNVRYADFDVHPHASRWVLAVREDHQSDTVENAVAAIDGVAKSFTAVASGHEFYAHPRFSPGGEYICYIAWDHPDMPWTGTVLYVAAGSDGAINATRAIAGKAQTESLYQAGKETFVTQPIKLKGLEEAEFAAPGWSLGSSTYIALTATTLVATYTKEATDALALINLEKNETSARLSSPYHIKLSVVYQPPPF